MSWAMGAGRRVEIPDRTEIRLAIPAACVACGDVVVSAQSAVRLDCARAAFIITLGDEVLLVTADEELAWRFAMALCAQFSDERRLGLHIFVFGR